MVSSRMARSRRRIRARHLGPARTCHELSPAPIKLAVVALTHAKVTGPGLEAVIEALVPQSHLRVKEMRRDTTPRQVRVHSCQLSISSCSKVPDGLNPRTPASRIASLTCGGAALSA